jgi:hypothetical protein
MHGFPIYVRNVFITQAPGVLTLIYVIDNLVQFLHIEEIPLEESR